MYLNNKKSARSHPKAKAFGVSRALFLKGKSNSLRYAITTTTTIHTTTNSQATFARVANNIRSGTLKGACGALPAAMTLALGGRSNHGRLQTHEHSRTPSRDVGISCRF